MFLGIDHKKFIGTSNSYPVDWSDLTVEEMFGSCCGVMSRPAGQHGNLVVHYFAMCVKVKPTTAPRAIAYTSTSRTDLIERMHTEVAVMHAMVEAAVGPTEERVSSNDNIRLRAVVAGVPVGSRLNEVQIVNLSDSQQILPKGMKLMKSGHSAEPNPTGVKNVVLVEAAKHGQWAVVYEV